jgi:hypothetical protein
MEELYAEGVAIHGGPESCVDVPQGRGEALTGVRAGRAMEPRNHSSGCHVVAVEPHCRQRYREAVVVREPGHVRNLHAREPGGPALAS